MSKSIRSEGDANRALYLASLGAPRDDWRVLLAKREAKRVSRHYRQARRPMSAGLARIGALLFAVGLGVSCAGALFLSLSA